MSSPLGDPQSAHPAAGTANYRVGPFEILEWKEERAPDAETLLQDQPEVEENLLMEVGHRIS